MPKAQQPNRLPASAVDIEIAEGESIFDEKTRRFYRKGDEGDFVADTNPDESSLARLQELGVIGVYGQVKPGSARMPDPTLTAGRHDPERTGDFARSMRRPEDPPAHDQDDISPETSGLKAGRYEGSKRGREPVRSNAEAAKSRAGGRARKATKAGEQ